MTYERPDTLPSRTYKHQFLCEGHTELQSFFLHLNDDPDTGELVEVLLTIGTAGRCQSCWGGSIGRLMSTALQDGVKPERLAMAFIGVSCSAAVAGHPASCHDWIGQTILKHIKEDRDGTD